MKMPLKDLIKLLDDEIQKEQPNLTPDEKRAVRLAVTNAVLTIDAEGYQVSQMTPGGNPRMVGDLVHDYYNK